MSGTEWLGLAGLVFYARIVSEKEASILSIICFVLWFLVAGIRGLAVIVNQIAGML